MRRVISGRSMRMLTIPQPHAEMIRLGRQVIENRDWWTSYRGPLVIHAGLSRDGLTEDDEREYPEMAFGAAVAIADLVDCVRLEDLTQVMRERHDARGPWCWQLRHVRPMTAVPVKGGRGLVYVPASIAGAFTQST
jgi:hypothetical protein